VPTGLCLSPRPPGTAPAEDQPRPSTGSGALASPCPTWQVLSSEDRLMSDAWRPDDGSLAGFRVTGPCPVAVGAGRWCSRRPFCQHRRYLAPSWSVHDRCLLPDGSTKCCWVVRSCMCALGLVCMGAFLRSLFEGELHSGNAFGILGKGRPKTFRRGVTFFLHLDMRESL